MRREIPLWEMHVLPRRRQCFVLRFHHALGDGISLLALILASCERAGKPGIPITYSRGGGEGKRRAEFSLETSITGIAAGTWRTVKKAWYTLLYSVDTSIKLIRPREDMMAIAGLVGVDLLPRKLATLALCLDDMKAVKNKLNATINDVFVGIISCGIAKYLKLKSSNEASKDCVITALSSVSTRGKGSKDVLRSIKEGKKVVWGNKLGYFLLPLHLKRRSDDPLNYVRKARAMLNRRKLSLQPQYSYKCCALIMNLLGSKVADSLGYKMFSSMSLVLSNIVGPLDAITFAKNRITKMGVTTTSLPLPLEIHMLTYDGKAFLNVLVAADIIHDPELLCLCFQEALRDMKSKVMNAEKYDGKILR